MSKVAEYVTGVILKKIEEEGVLPWKKPWNVNKTDIARNYKSKRPYSGVNYFMTNFSQYDSPNWLTFNQIKEKEGQIKKGSKGTMIVYYKLLGFQAENKSGDLVDKTFPMLRYYYIYNEEQIEGIEFKNESQVIEKIDFTPIEKAENFILQAPKPSIEHHGSIAVYSLTKDQLTMPPKEHFHSELFYYQILFHELSHSTGHPDKLNRDMRGIHDKKSYSLEELTAELSSCMIQHSLGIFTDEIIENSSAYINGYYNFLKKDPKVFIRASAQAQKSFNYLANISEVYEENE